MTFCSFLYVRILADSSTWDETVWDRNLISKSSFAFFMVNHTESRKMPQPEDLLGVDYFLAIVAGLAYFQMYDYPNIVAFVFYHLNSNLNIVFALLFLYFQFLVEIEAQFWNISPI